MAAHRGAPPRQHCLRDNVDRLGTLQFGMYRAPKIWDVAAGVLLVEEAGGSVYHWIDQAWHPFHSFGSPPATQRHPSPTLRDWSQPLVLGGSAIAGRVARSLRPRTGLKARLWPIAWRLFGG